VNSREQDSVTTAHACSSDASQLLAAAVDAVHRGEHLKAGILIQEARGSLADSLRHLGDALSKASR
jgi:hypothetical protein